MRVRRRSADRGRAGLVAGEGPWALPPDLPEAGGHAAKRETALARLGTIDGRAVVTVDRRGLVSVPFPDDLSAGAWSLDWWVGADDRWHLASGERGVRQRLVDAAPVVETSMRIPSGDAIHRAFVVQGNPEAPEGFVVVEVTNSSPVPFALALVVRPFTPAGWTGLSRVTVQETGGGRGRDVAHLVSLDGNPALILPRRAAHAAYGDGSHDVLEAVTSGAASADTLGDSEGGTNATAAFILPVTHSTEIRAILPLGAAPGSIVGLPSALPSAENLARGWAAQTRRGVRVEVPDTGLSEGIRAARSSLLITAAEPGAGGLRPMADLVSALDREGFHDEAARCLLGWPEFLVARSAGRDEAALGLAAIAEHWRLTRDHSLAGSLLPEVVALVDATKRCVHSDALADALAEMLAGIGQPVAAGRMRARTSEQEPPVVATQTQPDAWERLRETIDGASPTWAWPTTYPGTPAFLGQVRAVLLGEESTGLKLLPFGLGPWWGQGIEVHLAPTRFGAMSFALRWHGPRPAVLWELDAHDDAGDVAISAPALDTQWSTHDRRGEALLAAVPAPDGLRETMPSVVPAGMGAAESVAPRSVLPTASRNPDSSTPSSESRPTDSDLLGGSFR